MKYIDEYRDGDAARQYSAALHKITTRPWTLMEVCGGQTHAIVKFGVDELLPPQVRATSYGLRVAPNSALNVCEPAPNSGVLVLPMTIAPARLMRST